MYKNYSGKFTRDIPVTNQNTQSLVIPNKDWKFSNNNRNSIDFYNVKGNEKYGRKERLGKEYSKVINVYKEKK